MSAVNNDLSTSVDESICDQVMRVLVPLPVPVTGSDVLGIARLLRLWGVSAPSDAIVEALGELVELGEVSLISSDRGTSLVRLSS